MWVEMIVRIEKTQSEFKKQIKVFIPLEKNKDGKFVTK